MECLVNKLKAEADNNNMPYFGGILFNISATAGEENRSFNIVTISNKSIGLTVIDGDNLHFVDSEGNNIGTSIRTLSGTNTIRFSNDSGKILINDKYAIKTLSFNPSMPSDAIRYNVRDLSNIGLDSPTTTKTMNYHYLAAEGDISMWENPAKVADAKFTSPNLFGQLPTSIVLSGNVSFAGSAVGVNITQMDAWSCTVLDLTGCVNTVGDISGIGTVEISEFKISNSGITGSVEGYFETLWSLGRRSGTRKLTTNSLTFNGVAITSQATFTGTFSDSGITLNNGASYDGNSWTYPS